MEVDQTESDTKANIITPKSGNLTVEQLDIEILPVIYEIIRSIEKDPIDNSTKQRESQDCCMKVFELQERLESARSQISQLSGIEYNKDEQMKQLELMKNQVVLKQQLIKKYKNMQF